MPTRVHIPAAVAPLTVERLHSLVENRTVYSLDGFELNVFETHQAAHRVQLRLDGLALTTMLRGKKVMHLPGRAAFDYLPGESVVVDKDELMEIDFPEACLCQPTQCLAVAIAPDTIRHTVDLLNERYPRAEAHQPWNLQQPEYAHLTNTPELTDTLGRLVAVSRTTDANKDVLASFTLQELLVRLMQTQARQLIFHDYARYLTSHRFAAVVDYIKQHLAENLSIDKLSALACMSKATFFRVFKREFGITPVEFIIRERLSEAKRLLRHPLASVAEVCMRAGFNNISYFQALFKKYEGVTPGAYKRQMVA
ncbi:AraC family transcriptional regulator [Hymenobacter sp. BT770]|uniref:helix-turn-helix transcriptional regulator n=1 Tax=Hymenobacter sp. BT770 TaxID=2886942 RepID=UPI001D1044DF|nr:AraC family transcriptional regulator [Hymenobacter sp. BT770]MCC3151692.1 AraC family transcriptional regulator [Hymenobacter sp. BT770]MDO3413730.1 AraC family transcriptional regulator [Hymenobacter sp. BT770]